MNCFKQKATESSASVSGDSKPGSGSRKRKDPTSEDECSGGKRPSKNNSFCKSQNLMILLFIILLLSNRILYLKACRIC